MIYTYRDFNGRIIMLFVGGGGGGGGDRGDTAVASVVCWIGKRQWVCENTFDFPSGHYLSFGCHFSTSSVTLKWPFFPFRFCSSPFSFLSFEAKCYLFFLVPFLLFSA